MGALLDAAAAILSRAQVRVDVSAQNIANLTTYGYKRQVSFETLLRSEAVDLATSTKPTFDLTPGKLVSTGIPTDLALTGSGFFVVRGPSGPIYTRQGQLQRDPTGRLVTAQGWSLQSQGGADIVLGDGPFEVTGDGVVVQSGQPVARVAVADLSAQAALTNVGGGFVIDPDAQAPMSKSPGITQGSLETSNVSTGDEMVVIMEALRRAEAGQRLVNVYDDLMGRAIGQFGQS